MPYRCVTCGQDHDDLPDLGCPHPDSWLLATDEERAAGQWTSDLCTVGGHYFIRGVIEIPLRDFDWPFGFGCWVSQRQENFLAYAENPSSSSIGPFFGWLNTRIAYYMPADTRGLKTMAHFVGGTQRPKVEVDPESDHPLAVAQGDGLTLAAAWDIVHFYMDEPKKPAKRTRR